MRRSIFDRRGDIHEDADLSQMSEQVGAANREPIALPTLWTQATTVPMHRDTEGAKAMNKEQWIELGNKRQQALQCIAEQLGKEHTVTKMLGSLARGRHNWETGPNRTLQSSIVLAAALDGVYETINIWARDHDCRAHDIIINTYHGRET